MGKKIDPRNFPKGSEIDLAEEKACSDGHRKCVQYRQRNSGSHIWPLGNNYEAVKQAMQECSDRRGKVRTGAEKGEPFEVEPCKYISPL